jgi:uncharacterized protein YjiS (DUF1127 family)
MFGRFLLNKRVKPAKRQAEPLYLRLSDADLADMGIKRYQLESPISSRG